MVDVLEDAKESPEGMASNFTCALFETPQAVLKGARHMAEVEMSGEPSVRKHVHSMYLDHAVVSTSPTTDGIVAIDSFHQFAGVKWLREKPISKFVDSQWLLIQKAAEEKLLPVTIKLPERDMKMLVFDFDHYLSDGVSKSAQLWNEQRNLILQDAIHNFLLPAMEKEARHLLTTKAKNWLVWEYREALWSKVSVGPYQRKESDVADGEAAPRVMACCWGPGKPATTKAIKVLKFMTEHQPHVVVLGAVNLSCTKLKEDIYEIIYKMIGENPRDISHEMDELSIVYRDGSLPRLYENSRIFSDQLTGQSGIVKRAVA